MAHSSNLYSEKKNAMKQDQKLLKTRKETQQKSFYIICVFLSKVSAICHSKVLTVATCNGRISRSGKFVTEYRFIFVALNKRKAGSWAFYLVF
jgi:hypothetical protein